MPCDAQGENFIKEAAMAKLAASEAATYVAHQVYSCVSLIFYPIYVFTKAHRKDAAPLIFIISMIFPARSPLPLSRADPCYLLRG